MSIGLRIATVVASLFLAPAVGAVQDHPTAPHRHAEGERLVNPVAKTPESVKAGGAVYARACASCHGPNGLGNGRLAAAMGAYGGRPSNLADQEWQHGQSDGEVFLVIRDGVGPDFHMPKFQGKLSDEEIWQLVNYIRTLAI